MGNFPALQTQCGQRRVVGRRKWCRKTKNQETAARSKTRMHSSVFEIQLLTSVSRDCCVPARCQRVWPSLRLCFSRRQPAWEIVQICDSSSGAAAGRRVICLFQSRRRLWKMAARVDQQCGGEQEARLRQRALAEATVLSLSVSLHHCSLCCLINWSRPSTLTPPLLPFSSLEAARDPGKIARCYLWPRWDKCVGESIYILNGNTGSPLGINGLFMSHCKHGHRKDEAIMCVSCRTASTLIWPPSLDASVGLRLRITWEWNPGRLRRLNDAFSTQCVCQILLLNS